MKTIPLTRGLVALVDDEDYEALSQYKWRAMPTQSGLCYAIRSQWDGKRNRTVLMHCQIMGATPGHDIDHKNHDGLNNQRENLRVATRSQNQRNRKPKGLGYHGVNRVNHAWRACCFLGGKQVYLGVYATPEQAAWVRDEAIRAAGLAEYAVMNNVPPQEIPERKRYGRVRDAGF